MRFHKRLQPRPRPTRPPRPPSNYEPIHQGFFGAADEEEGEFLPFVLPADVGVKLESSPTQNPARVSRSGLCIVLEEENRADMEDIFVSEEDEGAIEFEFEMPPAFTSPPRTPCPTIPRVPTFQARKPTPFCEFVSEYNDTAFSFPSVSLVSGKAASPSSPSATPLPTVLKRFKGPSRDAKLSPRTSPSPPAASVRHNSPLSDSSCGACPSFFPHPTAKTVTRPTLIPPPSTIVPSSYLVYDYTCTYNTRPDDP